MLSVLFVDDDPRFLEVMRERLAHHHAHWNMHFARGAAAGLLAVDREDFDVVVSDVSARNGFAFLETVRDRAPSAGRVVLTGLESEDVTLRSMTVAHQVLAKPAQLPFLEAAIEAAHRVRTCPQKEMRNTIARIEHLPSSAAIYTDLCRALDERHVDMTAVASVLSRDAALVAKLLSVVNSAHFGLRQRVTDVKRAVACLGHSLLRSIVIRFEVERAALGLQPQLRSIVDAQASHAVTVAELAMAMVPPHLSGDAYSAGLLHDVGKLVLAIHDAGAVIDIENEARHLGATPHCVERMRFGISHAEVGAMLLELWGVPNLVVDAVMGHHEPLPMYRRDKSLGNIVGLAEALTERDHVVDPVPPSAVRGAAEEMDLWIALVKLTQ